MTNFEKIMLAVIVIIILLNIYVIVNYASTPVSELQAWVYWLTK